MDENTSREVAGNPQPKRVRPAASLPGADPTQADANERTDMITERRSPGLHGGGGDSGWKKSRGA